MRSRQAALCQVDIRAGFVLGSHSAVGLSIYKVTEYALRAGVDGCVASLGALKRHLDPVLAAVSPVDEGALVGRQVPAARDGRVAQIRLVASLCAGRVARVVFEDEAGQLLVVADGGVLLRRRAEAAQDELDGGRLDGALRTARLLLAVRGGGSGRRRRGLVVNPVAKQLVGRRQGRVLAGAAGWRPRA